jgi:hypothetical protein
MIDKPLHCSACGKWQTEVENLISMPGPMFVCDGCVELLHEIEEKRKTGDPVRTRARELKLEELQSLRRDVAALRSMVETWLALIESGINVLFSDR